jgi:hypothetical protein
LLTLYFQIKRTTVKTGTQQGGQTNANFVFVTVLYGYADRCTSL